MVLLTCDFDINFALMSSLANDFIAACVWQQQQRVCGGGNGAVAVLRPRLSLSQSRTSCSYVIGCYRCCYCCWLITEGFHG